MKKINSGGGRADINSVYLQKFICSPLDTLKKTKVVKRCIEYENRTDEWRRQNPKAHPRVFETPLRNKGRGVRG